MARRQSLKRQLDDLQWGIRQTVAEARRKSRQAGGAGNTVNVARRANIVVGGNVGEDGASRTVSANQRVRVRQRGARTDVVSESEHTTSPREDRS